MRHKSDWWIQSLIVEEPFIDPISIYSLPIEDVFEIWVARSTAILRHNELHKD